ncbi:MAG: alpha-L-fucosidase [Treponema sp.]|jgi:alpha-L-fucosidase|nr:alpha-L-fucosidase [Treponema sp.]
MVEDAKKTAWFTHDRFGLFIHWGLYSIPARGEWIRSFECISNEDYQKYFDEFNPSDYNPSLWAKAAKNAGMKYAVMTAKHHDGFCLFDSALTDYKSTNTPCKRDLIREYIEAFRAEGIRVGLYYSLIDWHHPDYPHYGDRQHPMRNNEKYKGAAHNFDNYLKYMHGQIEELCTKYGKIDIFWFDFSYGDMRGEKWKATELVRMIRGHLPDVLMDNRLEASGEGFGSLASGSPSEYSGDFVSPEQIIPPSGILDVNNKPVVWESCITMNNHWGFAQTDKNYKPADMIVKKLVECVSKGGNMLLNIGPDAKGRIPPESLDILAAIGRWMTLNGKSVYGCGFAGIDKPEYGRVTKNIEANTLYYHVTENQIGYIPLMGLQKSRIKKVRLLSSGSEMQIIENWVTSNYESIPFVSFGDSPLLPDPVNTVVEVELLG